MSQAETVVRAGARTGPVARAADALNPVLVKEVRAALRGKLFRITLVLTLALALVVSLFVIVVQGLDNNPGSTGPILMGAMIACMMLGTHGFVPLAAMLSMSSEREENTLELLQLSGLAPWRIVVGKLLAALLQTLLLICAFAPFISCAFLLRGVALEQVLFALTSASIWSICMSGVGIWFGAQARNRAWRMATIGMFVITLLWTGGIAVALPIAALSRGASAVGWQRLFFFGSMFLFVLLLAVFSAAGRLMHREENRSTPMRMLVSALVVCWIVYAAVWSSTPALLFLWLMGLCMLPFLSSTSEREPLPRSVQAGLPRSRLGALLYAPWLPGGGRGALFALVHIALIALASTAVLLLANDRDGLWRMWIVVLYALIYVFLPCGFYAPVTAFVIAAVGFVVPTLILLFLRATSGGLALAHIGNPFWLLTEVGASTTAAEFAWCAVLAAIAFVAVVLNVPRMVRGLREVEYAHARRASKSSDEMGVAHAATVA